ncbi:DUF5686 and carboxypeptidase-like regulatory domain-containing protein [Chitinophaga oryziterrae]|nr:DUF5686 and carboxypeptidase-like regulatory domain-containing protein [Chitinophaga oryziterrae]
MKLEFHRKRLTCILCYKTHFLFLLMLVFVRIDGLSAQWMISGMVKDLQTEAPLSFANVYFKGTATGTRTNEKGYFELRLAKLPADSLSASLLGYTAVMKRIDRDKKVLVIDFELGRGVNMKQFVVNAGVNPALIILRKVIREKPVHNIRSLGDYSCNIYNKIELDIANFKKESIAGNRWLKPFAFLLNNIDSTSEDKPFLPVFLSETYSSFYRQRSSAKQKEVISAHHTSGINTNAVQEYLGGMYQQVNVYDNYIILFGKQFVSPVHDNGPFFYNYKLLDTQYILGKRYFRIEFTPKRPAELVFNGEMWVHDTSFAISRISLLAGKEANINFINRLSVVQEFTQQTGTVWFLSKDKMIADISPPGKKMPHLIGRRSLWYDSVFLNNPAIAGVVAGQAQDAVVETVLRQGGHVQQHWDSLRMDTLRKHERMLYTMMDTLKTIPLFRTYTNTVKFLATGKKEYGPLEIGPVYRMFSMNQLEGKRLRVDLATTSAFSQYLRFKGHLAYGINDEAFKGHISALWLLSRSPRSYLQATYLHELDNGVIQDKGKEEVGTDNIFIMLLRKPGIRQKFLLRDEKRLEYYKEWNSGFSVQFKGAQLHYYPFAPLPVIDIMKDGKQDAILSDAVSGSIKLQYAPGEHFVQGKFDRVLIGSKYPALTMEYETGVAGKGQYGRTFHKLSASITKKHLPLGMWGKLDFNVYAGKIWGTLPYYLLAVHPGNEIYYYNDHGFNMMNRFEFISDQYAGFSLEHNLGGGLFNYIPLIKKLKLRQFWNAKSVIGSLSAGNKMLNFNRGYMFRTLEQAPYVEVGTGVDNIFKFFRVDLVWRLTPPPLTQGSGKAFGLFGSFRLDF